MKKQTVEFSSHTANLALMRNCVRKFLNAYPFSKKERLLMVLGVDEACTNVIRYAYRLRDDQLISLQMEGLRSVYACGCATMANKSCQPNERSLA